MSTLLRSAAASLALAIVALPIAAQTPARLHSSAPPRGPGAEGADHGAPACRAAGDLLQSERARALGEAATALMATRSEWGRAAFSFERAAQASPPCDARSVDAWTMAARLYHHVGKPEASRLAFLAAAKRARGVGDLAAAAHALIDAAVIAVDQGDQVEARRAVLAADELSRSPRVPVERRQSIRMRIVDLRTTAGLDGG